MAQVDLPNRRDITLGLIIGLHKRDTDLLIVLKRHVMEHSWLALMFKKLTALTNSGILCLYVALVIKEQTRLTFLPTNWCLFQAIFNRNLCSHSNLVAARF